MHMQPASSQAPARMCVVLCARAARSGSALGADYSPCAAHDTPKDCTALLRWSNVGWRGVRASAYRMFSAGHETLTLHVLRFVLSHARGRTAFCLRDGKLVSLELLLQYSTNFFGSLGRMLRYSAAGARMPAWSGARPGIQGQTPLHVASSRLGSELAFAAFARGCTPLGLEAGSPLAGCSSPRRLPESMLPVVGRYRGLRERMHVTWKLTYCPGTARDSQDSMGRMSVYAPSM